MKIQSYSTKLYRELGEKVDYPMNYHVTGAIRLAHSRQRMEEFHGEEGTRSPGAAKTVATAAADRDGRLRLQGIEGRWRKGGDEPIT